MRPKTKVTNRQGRSHLAVFTAIDGTLLDLRTFDAGPARSLIQRLHDADVPVIPMSVMTLEEIAPIAASLGFRHAMVFEAGGAIARWSGTGWDVEPWGPPAETVLDVVRQVEDQSGASLLVYSALPREEAAHVSGRAGEMLEASRHRYFSEPFILESGDFESVKEAAASIGFSIRRGRRFLHLCRECDEGEAFTRLREELRCEIAVAVGGSPVDAEFLRKADVPIIVPGPDGEADEELLSSVPHARIAPAPGPAGWAAAVEEAWQVLGSARKRARRV